MELIRGLHNLRACHRGCVATIGNFDGVHRGHAAVIQTLTAKARELGLPACAVLFEPQPQEFLRPQAAPARLTRFAEKCRQLENLALQRLLMLKFNSTLVQLSAESFVEQVLVQGLGIRHLVVGDDFRFGRGRAGDVELLHRLGEQHDFDVASMPAYLEDGERISSTAVREALGNGELDLAGRLLGRAYSLSGRVRYGQQLARALGFRTANIDLGRARPPLRGVFAVEVSIGAEQLRGVANLGVRPTVGGSSLILEVALFDFDRDIYGQRLTVTFRHKLRDEHKFDSLDQLKAQVAADMDAARACFNAR